MKKITSLIALTFLAFAASAQTQQSPAMKKITDSICNCLSKTDMSKISTKEEATNLFLNCFTQSGSILIDLAQERHIDFSDEAAMNNLGEEIGKELLKENCPNFMQLSVKMAGGYDQVQKDNESTGTTSGVLKRIENKDFRYFVIKDASNRENSFIWLHYFSNSEKFMDNPAKFVEKKLKINWKETEVFLPQAKGYFKIKEITGIEEVN